MYTIVPMKKALKMAEYLTEDTSLIFQLETLIIINNNDA